MKGRTAINEEYEDISDKDENELDQLKQSHSTVTVVVNNAACKQQADQSSKHVDDLIENVLNGHNCAVFICDQAAKSKQFGKALDDMVTKTIERLKAVDYDTIKITSRMLQVTDSQPTDLLAPIVKRVELNIDENTGTVQVSGATKVVDVIKPKEEDTFLQTFDRGFDRYCTRSAKVINRGAGLVLSMRIAHVHEDLTRTSNVTFINIDTFPDSAASKRNDEKFTNESLKHLAFIL